MSGQEIADLQANLKAVTEEMSDQEIADLQANLKAVTDKLTILDKIIKYAKLGQPTVMAFRCSHSGMYFPAHYAKEWGKTTGIGLGPDIVSESLNSMYHIAPPAIASVKKMEDLMHPVEVSMAQVDLVVVPQDEFEGNQLVLHSNDIDYTNRIRILRGKQMSNPNSRVAAFAAEYARIKKGGLQ